MALKFLQIDLLGSFRLLGPEGRPVTLPTRKAKALLAYLAMQDGHSETRERLTGFLWGEADGKRARGNLRQTLSLIRKQLREAEAPVLLSSSEIVSLDTRFVTSDTWAFDSLRRRGDLQALSAASDLYRGDFMADVWLNEPAYEDWVAVQRTRFVELALEVLSTLLDKQFDREEFQAAGQSALRILAIDPLLESAHRRLMKIYAAQGRIGAALMQFDRCRKALMEELNIEPSDQTLKTREEILSRQSAKADEQVAQLPRVIKAAGNRIAVLSFANLSDTPSNYGFAESLADEIATELSRFRGLDVVYLGKPSTWGDDPIAILKKASDLGINYLVQGNVRQLGDRVRINVQLSSVESGSRRWAEKYDGELSNAFAFQDDISSRIASMVVVRADRAALVIARKKSEESLSDHEHVLRGRERAQNLTKVSSDEARAEFLRALEMNRECIPAYYNLAWTYYNAHEQGWLSTADQPLQLGISHASRALALDRLDGCIQATMAYGLASSRDYNKAMAHYEVALELNPNLVMIYSLFGVFLAFVGRAEDALGMFVRARALNPQPNDWHFGLQGIVEYTLKRYRQAIGSFERMDTTVNEIRAWHAASLAQLGQVEAAEELVEAYLRIAAQEMCEFPGDDPDVWQEHWWRAVPYQNSIDFDHLVNGLQKAGLPI